MNAMDLLPVDRVTPYAAADADITLRLVERLHAELEARQLTRLFEEL